jgi:hypothetical protein
VPNSLDAAAARPDAAASTSLGANPDGPNLVAQAMNSTGKDLEKPQPFEYCSPRVPTQGEIDTIAGPIEMLEEQNSVLSHIVDNILQDHYQGLSQTSLTNGLSQALFTSVVEQARLCNLLADHMKKSQLNTSDSLLPPSKLPMELTKEEGKSRNRKRAFPEMDLSEWGITCKEFCPRKGKRSDNSGKKLPSLKNFRPAFATIVDNPGILPINAQIGKTSHNHRGKALKQIRVIITRSQIFK